MHISISSLISALFSLATLTQALPVDSQNHDRLQVRPRGVSYSVVPVDGGPAATSEAIPMTVIETVTHSLAVTETVTIAPSTAPPATKTIISTKVVSASDLATTVVITLAHKSSTSSTKPSMPSVDPLQSPATIAPPLGPGPVSVKSLSTPSFLLPGTTTSTTTTTPSTMTLATESVVLLGPGYISTTVLPLSSSASPAPESTRSSEMCTVAVPKSTIAAAPTSSFSTTSNQYQTATKTRAYDHSQWHTTYPSWNATSTTTRILGTSFGTGSVAWSTFVPTTMIHRRK